METTTRTEPAQSQDAPVLAALVNYYASLNVMLYRDEQSIRDSIDRWVVAAKYVDPVEQSGRQIIGGASLMHLTKELAEVRSLVIAQESQQQGLGQALVKEIAKQGRQRGYQQLCALTLSPGFFARLGFRQVDMATVSPKVWVDCVHCPKNECCDEFAMILDLVPNPLVRDYSHLKVKLPVRAVQNSDPRPPSREDATDASQFPIVPEF